MRPLLLAVLLLPASAIAAWRISYAMTSEANDDYRVFAVNEKVLLCVDTVCYALSESEADSLAEIIYAQAKTLKEKRAGTGK